MFDSKYASGGRFAELERTLGEAARARAIYELAIAQPVLDMPEALWKVIRRCFEGGCGPCYAASSRVLVFMPRMLPWSRPKGTQHAHVRGGAHRRHTLTLRLGKASDSGRACCTAASSTALSTSR
jgi:hypothetical protein